MLVRSATVAKAKCLRGGLHDLRDKLDLWWGEYELATRNRQLTTAIAQMVTPAWKRVVALG